MFARQVCAVFQALTPQPRSVDILNKTMNCNASCQAASEVC
jgi:hypothetical protein